MIVMSCDLDSSANIAACTNGAKLGSLLQVFNLNHLTRYVTSNGIYAFQKVQYRHG